MKKCTACKIDREPAEFNRNKVRKDGFNNICKGCSRKRSKRYYKENPRKHKKAVALRNKKYRKEMRAFVDAVKGRIGCQICTEKEPCVLDFHHVDPGTKKTEVARLMLGSLVNVAKEIKKCVLLCANCHRKVHFGLIELPS